MIDLEMVGDDEPMCGPDGCAVSDLPGLAMDDLVEGPTFELVEGPEGALGGMADRDHVGAEVVGREAEEATG